MKKSVSALLCLLLMASVLLAACGKKEASPGGGTSSAPDKAGAQKEFLIGVIPAFTEGNPKVAMDKLGKLMSEKMSRPVKASQYPDYNAVVEALGAGKIQMAYLGPLTYVIANEKYGAKAIMAIEVGGKPYYYSNLITHKDSPYNSIDDVVKNADKIQFAFGDINSTSGSLVPGMALKKAGVFESKDKYKFKKVTYTGTHDATALSIQNKTQDVGAIDSAIYDTLVKTNKIDGSQFKVIWKSEQLFQYPFAVEKTVPDADIKLIQDTMKDIKDPDILLAFNGASSFIPAKNEDYAAILKAAKEDGRIK